MTKSKQTRLLLVESDTEMAQLFVDFLRLTQNCTIDSAIDANEALKLLGSKTYDMMLASNRVRGMAPREFFSKAAGAGPGMELVLMSPTLAMFQETYLRNFKSVHALPSPVVLQDLWSVIDRSKTNES